MNWGGESKREKKEEERRLLIRLEERERKWRIKRGRGLNIQDLIDCIFFHLDAN